LVEKLQSSIEQHQMILSRLFGTKDLDMLVSLPREELLNLALSKPAASSPTTSFATSAVDQQFPVMSEGAESLEALEQAPELGSEWGDDGQDAERIQGIQDVVNGLSLRVDHQTSYVGVSSINAALKVIFKSAPMSKSIVQMQAAEGSPTRSTQSSPLLDAGMRILPPVEEGRRLIESYFESVHPYFPMVDEQAFWSEYFDGSRRDNGWMGLANMVLALGSLASRTSQSTEHITYFQRARVYIKPRMDIYKNPSLEMLQALAMLGGYYVHYLNRPNEGDILMGSCLRMACSLGLHREYLSNADWNGEDQEHRGSNGSQPADIRRRTWWSIFCLDTWASATIGRPALGRMTPGVTVLEPAKMLAVRMPLRGKWRLILDRLRRKLLRTWRC
jgi:hypothetical protein